MTRISFTAAFAATTLLAGCGTTVISSTRSVALTAPVTAATVVYVSNIASSDAKPSAGTMLGSPLYMPLGTTGTRIAEDAEALGVQVLKLLPQALRAAGLRVDPAPPQSRMLPMTPTEVAALLGAPPRASRLSDFSGPAGSFSEALVAQLRKDGAIKCEYSLALACEFATG